MSDSKVVVLMSTYNGEKYLREMIDSIIAQDYDDFMLYIRDDGSTDKTKDILQEYSDKSDKVNISVGERNLGYPACFYQLTDSAPEADYYFFSDQDDVWFPNKLSSAVELLDKEDRNTACAYYANYIICDDNLNEIETSKGPTRKIEFKDTLYEVCGLEFTMAINRKAMELLGENKPSFAKARGTWMCMLFSGMGKIIYDERPCAYYRRHQAAVTSDNMSRLGLWKWRLKKFLSKEGSQGYRDILTDFNQTVGPKLSRDKQKAINLFANRRYFPYAIKKVFYPKRLRRGFVEEVALRLAFLINKF